MKKFIRVIIISLAVVGVVSIVDFLQKLTTHEREANAYLERCKDVKVGMTLKEVREVMGDSTWKSMKNSGEFRYNYHGESKAYQLDYPAVFAASGWPIVKFDAETMRVINVKCENM